MSSSVRELAEVYAPLIQPSRYKAIYGGRGSAKSHFFAGRIVDRCANETLRVVCIREVQRTLAESAKLLIEDKIRKYGLEDQFDIQVNRIRHYETDSLIIFRGMQNANASNIKSLEGFDIAWTDEAQNLSQRSLDLLRPTIRKKASELWFSWNPEHPHTPVDAFFRGNHLEGKDFTPPPRSIIVQANYMHNPWFPRDLLEEMEYDRSRDIDKYNHVWLGSYLTNSEARVFKNWKIEAFETPKNTIFNFGADWGFANDPTVLVRTFLQDGKLYIDYEAYKLGCEIDNTPALFDTIGNGMARNWPITADSARPETISYMKRNGYPRIKAAIKGPNSVAEGVEFLKSLDIIVHPRCKHVIDELTHYTYKIDKQTGLVLPLLPDKKNHTIDAIRYAYEGHRRKGKRAGVW